MGRARMIVGFLALGFTGLAASPGSRAVSAAEDAVNACGCRQGSGGLCYCEKKSHCGCPGECEPKGCEERRAKQLDKEIQAETRKAEEATRRQNARRSDPDQPSPADDQRPEGREEAQHAPVRREPPKARIVKMSTAQKRDLARLIRAYLGEHPDQAGKAIGQVETEVTQK